MTPLALAAKNGHKDVVELLLSLRANVNAKDKNGFTLLEMAASDTSNQETFNFLRLYTGAKQGPTPEPNSGYVADAVTALEIGKVVLHHFLTSDEFIRKELHDAKLKDGVWRVSYSEPKTCINFPVVVYILQKTGQIMMYEDPNVGRIPQFPD